MISMERFKAFERFENGDGITTPIIEINNETNDLYVKCGECSFRIGDIYDSLEDLEDRAFEAYLVITDNSPYPH